MLVDAKDDQVIEAAAIGGFALISQVLYIIVPLISRLPDHLQWCPPPPSRWPLKPIWALVPGMVQSLAQTTHWPLTLICTICGVPATALGITTVVFWTSSQPDEVSLYLLLFKGLIISWVTLVEVLKSTRPVNPD